MSILELKWNTQQICRNKSRTTVYFRRINGRYLWLGESLRKWINRWDYNCVRCFATGCKYQAGGCVLAFFCIGREQQWEKTSI